MNIATLRTLALFAPLLPVIGFWILPPPGKQRIAGLIFACAWLLPSLLALLLALYALADLAWMPQFAPLVQLGPNWLLGEAPALTTCLLPAPWIARATVAQRRLACRALGGVTK